jgi:hypothetical protein
VSYDPELTPVRDKLRGVYTFGQPMVTTPQFAAQIHDRPLGRMTFRHVYDQDIVPRLPPATTGPFRHFGLELCPSETRRGWTFRSPFVSQAYTASISIGVGALAWVLRQFPVARHVRLPFSWDDHSPTHYIDVSSQSLQRSLRPGALVRILEKPRAAAE